jgi:hypothetical protein
MFTHQGIAIDAWAKIEGECPISYEVVGDEVQFELGGSAASLNLVATEKGLTTLVSASLRALSTLRENTPALPPEPEDT